MPNNIIKEIGKLIQQYENAIAHETSKSLASELGELIKKPTFEFYDLVLFYLDKIIQERNSLISRLVATSILEDVKILLMKHLQISNEEIESNSPAILYVKAQGHGREKDLDLGLIKILEANFGVDVDLNTGVSRTNFQCRL